MPVPLDNPEQSNHPQVAQGCIAKEIEILKVEDFSNYPNADTHYKIGDTFEPEICVVIYYNDNDKERAQYLMGRFKRSEKDNKVTGWDKFNNAVQWLLFKMFPNGVAINDDLTIPKTLLDQLTGRKIFLIKYITNGTYTSSTGETKHSWDTWNKVFPAEIPIEEIQSAFAGATSYLTGLKKVEKRYNPSLALGYGKESGFDQPPAENTPPLDDNDLPF